jgi:hypothetical protein
MLRRRPAGRTRRCARARGRRGRSGRHLRCRGRRRGRGRRGGRSRRRGGRDSIAAVAWRRRVGRTFAASRRRADAVGGGGWRIVGGRTAPGRDVRGRREADGAGDAVTHFRAAGRARCRCRSGVPRPSFAPSGRVIVMLATRRSVHGAGVGIGGRGAAARGLHVGRRGRRRGRWRDRDTLSVGEDGPGHRRARHQGKRGNRGACPWRHERRRWQLAEDPLDATDRTVGAKRELGLRAVVAIEMLLQR